MANESQIDIKIVHNLPDVSKELDEFIEKYNNKSIDLKIGVPPGWANTGGAPSKSGAGPINSPMGSSPDQNLTREYMRTATGYYKASMPFLKVGAGLTAGLARGGYSMAFGGGFSGLSSGINNEIQRAFKSSGIFAQTLSGAAVGATSRTSSKAGSAASGLAAGEAEDVEGALAKGAEQGIGWGLIQGFGKLAGPLGKIVVGAMAVAGLDMVAMDKAMKDVYGRSRRAGGYGANLGELTAFDATMGRFVDTDSVMAAMGQAKYDITSGASIASMVSGIHPNEWKDTAAMAEGTILTVQKQLKEFPENIMLTQAHARKFNELGLSDQDLIRLYTGDQTEVNKLVQKAQAHKADLDIPEEQQRAYKDLYTDADLAGKQLKTMSEDILSDQIPAFKKLAEIINGITDAYRVSPNVAPGNWNTKGVPDIPIPPSLTGKGDVPSEYATPKEFEIGGVGNFAIPGSEKVPDNIQDIRDAIVNDRGVTKALSDGLSGSFGGGGAPVGYGEAGGPAPIYHSGGMGEAGEPREVTRGGGAISGVARPAKGALKANQKAAYDAAIAEGLSDSSARAVVANMSGESLANPADVHADPSKSNPNQKAHGIVSWDDARSARIMKQFGKMPNDMSVANQVKAFAWEAKNYYPNTWKALQGGGSTESKVGTLVSDYERPGNVSQATSQRLGFLKGLPSNFSGAPASAGKGPDLAKIYTEPSDVVEHCKAMRDAGMITNEQCVALATGAVGIKLGGKGEGAWTGDWRRGESAEAGGLVAGTPISTFLNRQGRIGDTYAIGGNGGQMGAGLDHAAVFEKYMRDKAGKIYGMDVMEQYKGSRGMHEREYDFGKGWGERNASNYSAIDVASGGHLGGANNPLTQRDQDAVARMSGERSRRQEASMPHRPTSTGGATPHIGDVSQYQMNPKMNVNINNTSGANVTTQMAMLGSSSGSFGSSG